MTDLSTVRQSAWLEVHPGLGISLMDHLFNRLDGLYPNRWRASFSNDQAVLNWRESWSEAFDDERITPRDVSAGIKTCRKTYDWPPSLPEFLKACRPPIDYERLYIGASNAVTDGRWQSKLAYWSAQSVGVFEVRNEPYKRMESRWKKAVDELLEDGELPEIPPRREALPAPGRQSISREDASKRAAGLGVSVGSKDPKKWARKIIGHHENYPAISLKYATDALGSKPENEEEAA